MNDHDDTQLDAAIEALARPDAPGDHVARVLARTSEERIGSRVETHGGQLVGYLRPRWVLPVAATMLAVLGATWQIERQAQGTLDDVIVPDASGHASGRAPAWGQQEEVVQPVLPPQAYWGMDPLREFATLRTGTQEHRNTGTQVGRQARASTAHNRASWVAPPSDLPPIDLESIVSASLDVAPAEPLEVIALADIPLAPLVIDPIAEKENP